MNHIHTMKVFFVCHDSPVWQGYLKWMIDKSKNVLDIFHFIYSYRLMLCIINVTYLCFRISNFYCHVTIVTNVIDIMVLKDRFSVMIRNNPTCTVHIQRIFNSDCNATNTRWKPTRERKVHVTGGKKCVDLS